MPNQTKEGKVQLIIKYQKMSQQSMTLYMERILFWTILFSLPQLLG